MAFVASGRAIASLSILGPPSSDPNTAVAARTHTLHGNTTRSSTLVQRRCFVERFTGID